MREAPEVLADIHARLTAIEARLQTIQQHDPPWGLEAHLDLWGVNRAIVGVVK